MTEIPLNLENVLKESYPIYQPAEYDCDDGFLDLDIFGSPNNPNELIDALKLVEDDIELQAESADNIFTQLNHLLRY